MRIIHVLSLFALSSIAAIVTAQAPKVDSKRPVSTAETIVAIYAREGWVKEFKGPTLVMAVWVDGSAVWSEDRSAGGPPYRSGRVDSKRLTSVIARIEADGYFDDDSLGQLRLGPDAGSTVLLARAGKKAIRMESWHELYEGNGAVAGDRGLYSSKEQRLAALKGEPAKYLHYRLAWSELRGYLTSLIPSENRPIEGKLFHDAGEVFWSAGM
jgi:hypothetical protein